MSTIRCAPLLLVLVGCGDAEVQNKRPGAVSLPAGDVETKVIFKTAVDLTKAAPKIKNASLLAVDGAGGFRVLSDAEPKVLYRISAAGKVEGKTEKLKYGLNTYKFFFPVRIACEADGSLYICDMGFYWVQRFSASGEVLAYAGRGVEGSPVLEVSTFALDGNGHLHITDGDKVHEYTNAGRLLGSFGAKGEEEGQYRQIGALAVDGTGNLFVLDVDRPKVHVYDRQKKHVRSWKVRNYSGFLALHGDSLYVGGAYHVTRYDHETGKQTDEWVTDEDKPEFLASALAAGPNGVFLLDRNNLRILKVE